MNYGSSTGNPDYRKGLRRRKSLDSTTETKPSEPAMRAAEKIVGTDNAESKTFKDCSLRWEQARVAKIIDESTQLPQILEALEEYLSHPSSDGKQPIRSMVRVRLRDLLAAHKP